MKNEASLPNVFPKIDFDQTSSVLLSVVKSNFVNNQQWDNFLSTSSYGHFYQSSQWGQVRKIDGWQPSINMITLNNQIVGGFQMLWRSKSYLGKISIILKGPIVHSDDPLVYSFALKTIKQITRREGIRALIIQPPDKDKIIKYMLKVFGFSTNHLDCIIENNTVCIDLQGSEEEVLKRVKRQKRQNINIARKNGITVRLGIKEDLITFFEYMTQTCKRHCVKPSPSNINFLNEMWDLLAPQGKMKLFMAQHAGKDVSGLIVLPLGETAYMWKFGWSGVVGHLRPNELLYWEIMKWARDQGYKFADIGAVNTKFAQASLQHQKPDVHDAETEEYRFKTEFGGKIMPLSNGFVYFPNPIIKWAYNLFMPYINSKPALKNKLLFSTD